MNLGERLLQMGARPALDNNGASVNGIYDVSIRTVVGTDNPVYQVVRIDISRPKDIVDFVTRVCTVSDPEIATSLTAAINRRIDGKVVVFGEQEPVDLALIWSQPRTWLSKRGGVEIQPELEKIAIQSLIVRRITEGVTAVNPTGSLDEKHQKVTEIVDNWTPSN